MAKMKTTVGVTAGIFNKKGDLLLIKRKRHDSITGIDYYGCLELPIVAVQTKKRKPIPYDYLCRELVRGVKEETGIKISVNPMPGFYPVMFKNKKGEYDLAIITPFCSVLESEPTENEIIYVDLLKLNNLAREYVPAKKDREGRIIESGKGLLSGFGKRQHCMALKVIELKHSNSMYSAEAKRTLREIQKEWNK